MDEPRRLGLQARHSSRKRRSAADTERAFIAAATELFAEKGYNGTSISDLAKELGLTTGSLYYHVSGKQELLLRVLGTGMERFLHQLEAIASENPDPRLRLRLAVENHLSFVLEEQDSVTVFLRERRFLEPPYRQQYQELVDRYETLFTAIVSEAMEAESIPRGDPHLIRLAILGMINWVVEWYNPKGRYTREEIRSTFADLITERMLASPR